MRMDALFFCFVFVRIDRVIKFDTLRLSGDIFNSAQCVSGVTRQIVQAIMLCIFIRIRLFHILVRNKPWMNIMHICGYRISGLDAISYNKHHFHFNDGEFVIISLELLKRITEKCMVCAFHLDSELLFQFVES